MTIILKSRTESDRRLSTVVDALAMWASWEQPFPPLDATGDPASDRIISETFRELIAAPDNDAVLAMIEARTFSTSDFPNPSQPLAPWRTVLIRWWLQIHEAAQ